MEGCPAALTEGPCEVLMWFCALARHEGFLQELTFPPQKVTYLRCVGKPGLEPGMAKMLSLCCPSKKTPEEVLILQKPIGADSPW